MRPNFLLRDRFGLSLLSAAAVIFAVITLCWPVRLDVWDQSGFQISCGDGAVADYAQAATVDHETRNPLHGPTPKRATDYVGDCQSAIWWRRGWTAPLAIVGVVGLLTALLDRGRRPHDADAASDQ
jgi:hypothetical protein